VSHSAPVAFAECDVNRIRRNIHHGNITDDDIFHDAAVHFFKRQAAAAAEGAIGHRDVAETAVGLRAELDAAVLFLLGFIVPSSSVPSSKAETWQLTIVKFSVITFRPRAKLLLGHNASSLGELIRQLEIVVLRQQSMSMPSRFVSIVTLSTVIPSQPVARMAK